MAVANNALPPRLYADVFQGTKPGCINLRQSHLD
jgi:hypothetical protein